jgi:pyrimidine oxygenase
MASAGPRGFWDYNLESFTLMAGLASVTTRIQLFATCAVLTMPPPFTARMAVTIDSISHGRFGVNIISGWQRREYAQMGIWPGSEHYLRRYDYCSEYVTVMKELWETGRSDFKGDFFQMDDCRCLPMPTAKIPIISAGQSDAARVTPLSTPIIIFVPAAASIRRPMVPPASPGSSRRTRKSAASAARWC